MYVHSKVCKNMTDVKLFLLHSNTWNHLKKTSGLFKNVINKMCLLIIYIYIYMCVCVCVCVELNNLQWLIRYKTQVNQSLD